MRFNNHHFATPKFDPQAKTGAIITVRKARFTVLTDRLIRMEFSLNNHFEDRPSQIFWYRRQPVPQFECEESKNEVDIETEYLHLHYFISERGFTPQTLEVTLKSTGVRWRFGEPISRSHNLHGTARTLDEAAGGISLEPGLMARAGWSVVDDSHSLVFNNSGWLEARPEPLEIDLYFFGYGHDYVGCLRDYYRLSGPVPLIPRWALGNWWSRYWEYSADELLELMQEFMNHQTPLAVCIIDMDWHLTETDNTCSGWTSYSWNRKLFPDPAGFIQRLHDYNLKTALNLHPAEGIHPHEETYPAFARYMGQNPDSLDPIPFDSTDPHFMHGYFELLHHPLEAQGVDFWWLDWQQGQQTRLRDLDPLWWLNHLHFYDLMRDGSKRPFIFSRWGGLGNHRYPIGFSGDTIVGWEALDFQPGFTSTAANVGYGWWSHDIGGHMGGIEDDELYVRWVQYGVFSPILRLHSTKNRFHERKPWGRGPTIEKLAVTALRLRHTLIPYLYTMAWQNSQTGLPPITPLYYTQPEEESAFICPQAYWFGSELIAAPFTRPASTDTHLSRQTIWLPEQNSSDPAWFDFFSGERFEPGWHTIYGELKDIPVFARPGAIIPLAPETAAFGAPNPEILRLLIFPGADNHFELYEDDGETLAYQDGHFALSPFTLRWTQRHLEFTIGQVKNDHSVCPPERTYELYFYSLANPDQIQMSKNGTACHFNFTYQEYECLLVFDSIRISPEDTLSFKISTQERQLLISPDHTREKLRRYLGAFRLNTYVKQAIDRDWEVIRAGKRDLRSYRDLTEAQIGVLKSLLEQLSMSKNPRDR
jgi:alpha-glucosidase (family GH31 glycosyl hydrolase)